MPRSSKAPEPPPEPDFNELMQNDVARIKRLLGLDVNRLALGSEVEGIVTNGTFGSADYTITGVNVIEFVNVSTSIGPAQGSPPQITGLTATPVSNTQINLAWTAYSPLPAGFTSYNVYTSTSPGFTPSAGNLLNSPVSNSYNHTGLLAGTDHYYQVTSTVAGAESTPSVEVGATTTGGVPLTPLISLSLDNNYTNSGSASLTVTNSGAAFATPGKFGTHYSTINPSGTTDFIGVGKTNLNISTSGWSVSFWVQPKSLSAVANDRQVFAFYNGNVGVDFWFSITTEGWYKFHVQRSGFPDITRGNATNPVVNVWNHIVLTFTNSTNTPELYVDKVAGMNRPFHGDFSGIIQGSSESLRIGIGSFTGPSVPLHPVVWIDEFKIWNNVVLTQSNINNLFSINATA